MNNTNNLKCQVQYGWSNQDNMMRKVCPHGSPSWCLECVEAYSRFLQVYSNLKRDRKI